MATLYSCQIGQVIPIELHYILANQTSITDFCQETLKNRYNTNSID